MLILISGLVTLLVVELFVRRSDPLGIILYFNNGSRFVFREDANLGYVLEPGQYQFIGWSSNINADSTRFVPNTNVDAACTIVALGDSVTFGQGVSDNDTWLNLVAARFPDVHFINAGVPGYNIPNLLPSHQHYADRADGFLYTLIDNDSESPVAARVPFSTSAIERSAILLYIYALTAQTPPPMSTAEFYGQLDKLAADPRLVITAFDTGGISSQVARDYPAVSLQPMWTHFLTAFDRHPSPAGHQEIASSVTPIVDRLVQQVCV